MNRIFEPNLYLITDRHQTSGRALLEVVKTAVDAGVRAVQLRERDLPARELFLLAERVKEVTDRAGAVLLINDRIDVALAVGASGVHVRSNHIPLGAVRKLVGSERVIGVSCHTVAEVADAEKAGADFAVLGPIYDTPSKRPYGAPLGPGVLRQAKAVVTMPILAIGGITAACIGEVMDAGASGVAVLSGILGAADVRTAVQDVISALGLKSSRRLAIDRIESR